MISLFNLYHVPGTSKWYDFPKEGAIRNWTHRFSKREFRVIHRDGTISPAWAYGEKCFTYSYDELLEQQETDKEEHRINKERNELLKIFQDMSLDELREAVRKINS